MCGIVGIFERGGGPPPTPDGLTAMMGVVSHRGPDAAGLYLDDRVGLGHTRLSIVDLEGGLQPLRNEDESVWLICNGEVFNHVELRAELEGRGHRFRTRSDCETIVHLYEEGGADCVHALVGQFAFALWDRRRQQLLLARDRLGVRPLYYTTVGQRLIFASEIKALLTQPGVRRELDPVALGQVLSTWSPVPPRTMFQGIHGLRAGELLVADLGGERAERYWRLRFPERDARPSMSAQEAAERLREILEDAVRLRLRADVPVGCYLSGGLDSTVVTALASRLAPQPPRTFSVAFVDGEYDERQHQERVARQLGTEHHVITCGAREIAAVFPDLIWHTETPLVRTAPAPLYLLSSLVRRQGLRVVLTGEGADEFLVGYDIFKEAKIRAFWARQPDSRLRSRLLRRLYGHIPELARPPQPYLEAFFGVGLDRVGAPDFSHIIRWRNTARLHRYFTPDVCKAIAQNGSSDLDAALTGQSSDWHPVSRAQYVEATTFLDPYLLSSQGDRVAMAHAVEGRFPFLDHRLVEFCNTLPPETKMPGLDEKRLLKRAAADLVPPAILQRPKQPFRAPIRASFVGPDAPEYVAELLDPARVAADGVFNPAAVTWLLGRARSDGRLSEVDNMALVGIVSYGLFRRAFWDELAARSQTPRDDAVVVADCRGEPLQARHTVKEMSR